MDSRSDGAHHKLAGLDRRAGVRILMGLGPTPSGALLAGRGALPGLGLVFEQERLIHAHKLCLVVIQDLIQAHELVLLEAQLGVLHTETPRAEAEVQQRR